MGAAVACTGTVERVTFQNADSGWCVLRFRRQEGELITLVGPLAGVQKGEALAIQGTWETDPRYGPQVRVTGFQPKLPSQGEGLIQYLTTFSGIGQKRAARMVEAFGAELPAILEGTPERLREVKGITAALAARLHEEWRERVHEREVMLFCQGHGLTIYQSRRLFKQYGDQALAVLRSNPYRLAEDIHGIGFKKADEIAGKMGITGDDPRRVQAALLYTLARAADHGHMFLPFEKLVRQSAAEVVTGEDTVVAAALALIHAKRVIADSTVIGLEEAPEPRDLTDPCPPDTPIYLPRLHSLEQEIASGLARRLRGYTPAPLDPPLARAVEQQLKRQQIELSTEQLEAIRLALSAPVMLLTGGPGTGKSTCLKLAVDVLEAREVLLSLCAPTGRAAKRMQETTGRAALTIHRLLEFNPHEGGFTRSAEYPLDSEVVIVDEASMLDTSLCAALLRAMSAGARLVLVGDPDQLPSVGAGNVLADLIASGLVPRKHLTAIYRQAQSSQIVVNAHRINQGQMPLLAGELPGGRKDFLYKPVTEDRVQGPLEAQRLVLETVRSGFSASEFSPIRMIQVVTPMHSGPVGSRALNAALQEALNPVRNPRAILRAGAQEFRVGDRVMQIRNNYDKEVFNGDIGFITDIDRSEGVCHVMFDFEVSYSTSELDELQLAYAITVHKSQGSEFPIVVLPLVTQHFVMLQRPLIYTALTRAKKVAVLIAQEKAIWLAVQRGPGADLEGRHTGLRERVVHEIDRLATIPPPDPPIAIDPAALEALGVLLAAGPIAEHGFRKVVGNDGLWLGYLATQRKLAVLLEVGPDDPRVSRLTERGCRVLRFAQLAVLHQPADVAAVIARALA